MEKDFETASCCKCGKPLPVSKVTVLGTPITLKPGICDACDALRRIAETESPQAKQVARWKAICPPEFREGETRTDVKRIPKARLAKALEWRFQPRGLIFYGDSGTQKTRCMYLLLERLHRQGYSIEAFDTSDFANEASRRFMDGSGPDWIERLIKAVDIVFFDDLGNEAAGERGIGEIFHVIKRRGEQLKPVLITTNSDGDLLAASVTGKREYRGPALVRRLRDEGLFCESVEFIGETEV